MPNAREAALTQTVLERLGQCTAPRFKSVMAIDFDAWAAEAFVERMHLQPTERLLTVLPFFHINALFYSLGGGLVAGAMLVATDLFSASRFWDLAAATGATQFNTLAAVGSLLCKRPRSEFNPAHRIRRCTAARSVRKWR